MFCLVFGLPFSIINCLKLRRRQKIGLVGVFSLGAITIIISLARFIAYSVNYDVDDASGSKSYCCYCLNLHMSIKDVKPLSAKTNRIADAWCTAEMCTAVIVVSLPSLKPLIVRTTPTNTSNRSTNGYLQAGSGKPISHRAGTVTSHIQGGHADDEMELTFLDRKVSPTPTSTTGGQDGKDAVTVTTNVTVTRDVL